MPEIPAEAVRAVAVILRAWEVDQSGEGDIAPVAEFDADARELLAALAEQGYTIVRAEDIRGVLGPKRGVRAYIEAGRRLLDSAEHPAQPSGTLQDSETSGPGITGPIGNEKPATSLSEPRTVWTESATEQGLPVYWSVATELDARRGFVTLPTPIAEEKPRG